MKKLLYVAFIFCTHLDLSAQIEPVQNSHGLVSELNVKSISSFYYASTDTSDTAAELVLEKVFDSHGKIKSKYVLSLWEAVSYKNTTTFNYNEKGQLIEECKIQKLLILGTRDQEYIDSFGDTPLSEKITYGYNEVGELASKEIFTFSTDELSESAVPSQEVLFEYDSGKLCFEKSSSPNIRVFNKNFTVDYEYDERGNLTKKILSYGSEMDKKRISEFMYNPENKLIEEKIDDSGIPRNNAHFRYEYNDSGFLKSELIFDEGEEDFIVDESYEYDNNGNRISSDKDFIYYDNGLIRSELWKDEINDQIFYFISKYEFY